MAQEDSERTEKQLAILRLTTERIQKETTRYNRDRDRSRTASRFIPGALAVLGVAAPSLVTYQTQVDKPSGWLIALTILVTAIAGAASTLQAIFRWDERYRRTLLTSLALSLLESNTVFQREEIVATLNGADTDKRLRDLNRKARRDLLRIIREDVESEAKLVSQESVTRSPDAGSSEE